MATRTIDTKILNLVYTTSQLAQEPVASTIISKGVVIFEIDTDNKVKLKVGDGVNVYSALPYVSDPSVEAQINTKLETLTNIVTIKGTVDSLADLNGLEGVKTGDVYFVGTENGNYAEYIRTEAGQWEYIGQVAENIDLSGYYKASEVDTLLSNKANNVLTNFVDNQDSSNIETTDTIPSALSKLENQIKNKANDGSEIKLTGYEKGTDKSDVVETDTLNSAVGKIENKLDDKLDVNDTYTFVCTL